MAAIVEGSYTVDIPIPSILKRKNRCAATILCVIIWFLISPILCVSYALPQILFAVPVALLGLLGYIGPLSALICLGLTLGWCFAVFGMPGLMCALVFLLPIFAVTILCCEKKMTFWLSVLISAGTMLLSASAGIAVITMIGGSDVVSLIVSDAKEMLNHSGAVGELLVELLRQVGVLPIGGAEITQQTYQQTLTDLVLLMDSMLRLELPAQMTCGALVVGLFGQAALRCGIRKDGTVIDMPPLRTWRIPKGWGRILGCTLLLFYAATLWVTSRAGSMYYVYSMCFEKVFALQGIAAICFLLHKRGKKKKWEAAAFFVGFFLLPQAVEFIGIADQSMDIMHRREQLDSGRSNGPMDTMAGGNPKE